MDSENAITEQDMDAASHRAADGLRNGQSRGEPDLDVDGLSGSLLSWLMRIFSSFRRK